MKDASAFPQHKTIRRTHKISIQISRRDLFSFDSNIFNLINMQIQHDQSEQKLHKLQESNYCIQSQTKFSEYKQSYENQLGTNIKQLHKIKDIFLQALFQMRMISDKGDEKSELSLILVNHSHNHQCILLKVCYRKFQLLITVLFSSDRKSTHQIFTRFGGNFATVYKASIFNRPIAIKCTKFNSSTFADVFGDVVRQYFVFRILSQLKLGPKVAKSMGFDLIIGPDCIQFCTEFCQHKLQKSNFKQISKDLKETLIKLHSLSIIHGDIKTENICFSNAHSRYVFIDFGLHSMISEPLGQKTFTNFRGTVGYVLPEMQNCLVNESQQFVDLYYNDLFGLNISLQNILQQKGLSFFEKHSPGTEISDQIIINLMKGVIVERQFISDFIIETKQYRQIVNRYSQFTGSIQGQIQLFQNRLKGRRKTVSSIQQLQKICNEEVQDSEQQNEDVNFDFFKIRNRIKSIQQIVRMLTLYPFDRTFLILDGKVNETERIHLQDYEYCKTLKQAQYFLLVSKHIQITTIQFQIQKQKICDCFLRLTHQEDKMSQLPYNKLKFCYLYLINYSVKNKLLTKEDFCIFKLNIISGIVSEAIDTIDLLKVMDYSLTLQTSNIRKLRTIIAFLQGLQWIRERFYSRYQSNTILGFIYTCLEQLMAGWKQTSINSYEFLLRYCMELLLLPSTKPGQVLKIYKQMDARLYLCHFSTVEGELALFQAWNLLAVSCKLQGIKQSWITKTEGILSKISEVKQFSVQNNLLGWDIIFSKIDISFEFLYKNMPGFSKFRKRKQFIDAIFVDREYQQKSFLDLMSLHRQNLVISKNYENFFQVIDIFIFCRRSLMYNMQDQYQFQINRRQQGQLSKLYWYGLHKNKYLIDKKISIHQYSQPISSFPHQLTSAQLSQALNTFQDPNHYESNQGLSILKRKVHFEPTHSYSIVGFIECFRAQMHSMQDLLLFLLEYSKFSFIPIKDDTFYQLMLNPFHNIYRFFMKPQIQVTIAEFFQYLLATIIKMMQINPFSQLFNDFLLHIFLLVCQQIQSLKKPLVWLLYEICKMIKSFQLIFTVFLRKMGVKFMTLINEIIFELWVSNQKQQYFEFIQKLCEYLQKSNSRILSWYFSVSISMLSQSLQKLTINEGEDNNKGASTTINLTSFYQENQQYLISKSTYIMSTGIGMYFKLLSSLESVRHTKNKRYFIFCWLHRRQFRQFWTLQQIYFQFLNSFKKELPKRRQLFIERKNLFSLVRKNISRQLDTKCIRLKITRVVGQNHRIHALKNSKIIAQVLLSHNQGQKDIVEGIIEVQNDIYQR